MQERSNQAFYTYIEYGKEVDLWAYGVLLFELLAGYNPFFDRHPKKLYDNVMNLQINWPPYMKMIAKVYLGGHV